MPKVLSNLPDIYKKYFNEQQAKTKNQSQDAGDFNSYEYNSKTNHSRLPSDIPYKGAPNITDNDSNVNRPNYKNGLDDHQVFVDSMMKQGAKFRRTLKYGFPLEARKTITNDGSNSNQSIEKLNQTANVFRGKGLDSPDFTHRSLLSKTNRSGSNRNNTESPRIPGSNTDRSQKRSIKLNLTNQIKQQKSKQSSNDNDKSNLNFDSEVENDS